MAEIVFATPIMRGKEDVDRQTMDQIRALAGMNMWRR
jgi:hypothetical protein